MTESKQVDASDADHHAQQLRGHLSGLAARAREVGTLSGPKGHALFETAAEVCDGLTCAIEHYASQAEPAWQR